MGAQQMMLAQKIVSGGGGGSPTRVTQVGLGFLDAATGTTGNTGVDPSGSNRLVIGGIVCVKGFGLPTIDDCRYGGSGGTQLTKIGTDETFNFGSAALAAYEETPGPSAETTMYGAFTGDPNFSWVMGAFYENVNQTTPISDRTTAAGAEGDPRDDILVTITIPNTTVGQKVFAVAGFSSLSNNAEAWTPIAGSDVVLSYFDGLGGAVFLEGTASGSTATLQITANHGGGAGMTWRAVGGRINPV